MNHKTILLLFFSFHFLNACQRPDESKIGIYIVTVTKIDPRLTRLLRVTYPILFTQTTRYPHKSKLS